MANFSDCRKKRLLTEDNIPMESSGSLMIFTDETVGKNPDSASNLGLYSVLMHS